MSNIKKIKVPFCNHQRKSMTQLKIWRWLSVLSAPQIKGIIYMPRKDAAWPGPQCCGYFLMPTGARERPHSQGQPGRRPGRRQLRQKTAMQQRAAVALEGTPSDIIPTPRGEHIPHCFLQLASDDDTLWRSPWTSQSTHCGPAVSCISLIKRRSKEYFWTPLIELTTMLINCYNVYFLPLCKLLHHPSNKNVTFYFCRNILKILQKRKDTWLSISNNKKRVNTVRSLYTNSICMFYLVISVSAKPE